MTFPYKAILFDWAYTLVDLVQEDDRAAFESMMDIRFKPFACILAGMCLIGFSIGFILGSYIYEQFQTYFYMYV